MMKKYAFLLGLCLILLEANAQTYKTTWLGNTYGWGDGKWIQNHINSMYVSPEGKVYTNSIWDEAHNETGIYTTTGDTYGELEDGMRGLAVGGDGTYVYLGDGNSTSSKVKKYNLDRSYAGVTINLPANSKAYSIAARDGSVYVSDPNNNRILVYNSSNGSLIREFSVTRPADVAVDNDNNVWVIQSAYSYAGGISDNTPHVAAPKILSYTNTGSKRSAEITGIEFPSGLSIDKINNRLLITDRGQSQQIYCYKNLSSTPVLDPAFFNNGTFGQYKGVYTGNKGENGPDRFYKLSDVGMDDTGNLYVSLGGPDPHGDNPLQDTDLRKFSPDGSMQWQLLGKEFVDMGDLDPANLNQFYTKDSKYSLDWAKSTAGTEWSFAAHTIDPFKYPDDWRADRKTGWGMNEPVENVFMRRIGGKLFMFGNGMAGEQGGMRIWRFENTADGEIAIPCVKVDKWIPEWANPGGLIPCTSECEYMWRDLDADGQFDANEFSKNPNDEYPFKDGIWPDKDGNLWRAYRDRGIRKLVCSGLDANGIPQYSFNPRVYYEMPAPMTDVHYLRYFPETDVMYLAGFTTSHPNTGGDQPGGVRTIVRYNNWSTTRTKAWESDPADYSVLEVSISFDIAGDYIFTAYQGEDNHNDAMINGTVWVFNTSDGKRVAKIEPGPEVGRNCGWVDIWDGGIRAHKQTNGEYSIFVEDDWHNKTIIYRWCPAGGCTASNSSPTVSITSPANSTTFTAPATVTITANASDSDGSISKVEFYNGSNKLGEDTSSPYSFDWTNVTAGTYTITAKATDNAGSSTTSSGITITVGGGTTTCSTSRNADNPSNSTSGLDYQYYEGEWSALPNFDALTVVESGNATGFDLSIRNRNDNFAVKFTGYIDVATEGNYTFYTSSDDGSKLYIGSTEVVNNDALHGVLEKSGSICLKAGKHAITVSFFERTGDEVLNVSYSGPGITKQLIPSSVLYRGSNAPTVSLRDPENPANTTNGVKYSYYEGTGWSTIPAFGSLTAVKSGNTTNFDLSPRTRNEDFAFNFTGFINVPTDGEYTFYTTSDDGSKLYIGSTVVVDNDGLHGAAEKNGKIGLKAGKHAISVSFF